MTIYERRTLEIDRVVNLVVTSGWEEVSRKLDREDLSVRIKKDLTALTAPERRMAVDNVVNLVRVFGWSVSSTEQTEEMTYISLKKTLQAEITPPAE